MLRIKLSRTGKKKQASFRLLVIERHKDPWGTYLENVGTYNPQTQPSTLNLKEERVKHWLSVGAQPTDTVHNLLVTAGVIKEAKKRNVSKLGKKAKDAVKAAADEVKAKAKAEKEAAAAAKAEAEKPAAEAPAEETKPEEKKEEKPAA